MKTIMIEMTEDEVSLVKQALDSFETSAHSAEMNSAMLRIMLIPGNREETERLIQKGKERAEKTCEGRKLQSLRLRVKLMEAAQRPSEFSR